jgi:hypothetical protein
MHGMDTHALQSRTRSTRCTSAAMQQPRCGVHLLGLGVFMQSGKPCLLARARQMRQLGSVDCRHRPTAHAAEPWERSVKLLLQLLLCWRSCYACSRRGLGPAEARAAATSGQAGLGDLLRGVGASLLIKRVLSRQTPQAGSKAGARGGSKRPTLPLALEGPLVGSAPLNTCPPPCFSSVSPSSLALPLSLFPSLFLPPSPTE